MKGKELGVKFWAAVAVGALSLSVVLAVVAGFLLGHFTGHSHHDTTVAATSSQTLGEEAEAEEAEEAEAQEAKATEAEELEAGEAEAEETQAAEAEEAESAKAEAEESKPADAMAGAEVFSTNCAVCHGETGHGGSGGPDLRTMPLAKTQSGAEQQVTNGGGGMPAFGGTLSPEEIKNVAAYVVEEIVG